MNGWLPPAALGQELASGHRGAYAIDAIDAIDARVIDIDRDRIG